MDGKTTGDLNSELMKHGSFADYLKANEDSMMEQSVDQVLDMLLAEKKLSRAQAVRASGLNEIYGYQVLSGKRTPSRDKFLCICIGLGLETGELQSLLKICGYAPLYPRRKRDAVILFELKGRCTVQSVNEALFAQNEKTLC